MTSPISLPACLSVCSVSPTHSQEAINKENGLWWMQRQASAPKTLTERKECIFLVPIIEDRLQKTNTKTSGKMDKCWRILNIEYTEEIITNNKGQSKIRIFTKYINDILNNKITALNANDKFCYMRENTNTEKVKQLTKARLGWIRKTLRELGSLDSNMKCFRSSSRDQ